jgi:N-acyl-D-aspartate/D-glutamate deacylase
MSVFDIVLTGGRVLDPESGRDGIANVGISDGTIQAITNEPLEGRDSIDAAGLVVAPGAIDLHSHGQDEENYLVQARDGVTTALELEAGVLDIDDWYGEREGRALINFGASIGHIPVRMKVMNDPGAMLPIADAAYSAASPEQIEEMKRLLDLGLRRGALAMGFGLQYTPVAARWEVLEMFRVAARYRASCHVHMRGMGHKEPMNSIEGLSELIAASATSGAPLHLVHINSSGQHAVPSLLQMIEEARSNGVDVTTECYPYTAGMTGIESAILAEGWRDRFGLDYGDLEWAVTGERLTASSFAEYREIGGMVIVHSMRQDLVDAAVASPLTAIASDGYLEASKGHPRTAGCYTRILGQYVRDSGAITLMDAIRKSSLMPAQRLESLAPAFRKKGRASVGADADLVLFDAERVRDRSTYQQPTLAPEGVPHVLVAGTPVVKDGAVQVGSFPGTGVRSPGA